MTSDQKFGGPAYPTWELASPAEIRRRGEARALRRRLALCAGALAAAAMVSTAAVLGLQFQSGSRDVPMAQDQSGLPAIASGAEGSLQSIPSTFPLGTGMGSVNQQSLPADRGFSQLANCSSSGWADAVSVEATETAGVQGVGEGGQEERRVLAVFADSAAAQDAMAELERASKACGSEAGPRTRVLLRPSDSSDRWSYMLFLSTSPERMHDMNRLALLRIGNAVLVGQFASASLKGPASIDVPPLGLMGVVEAMCVFDHARC